MAREMTQRQRAEADCHQCGMVCQPNEYHPYAACILYGAIHDGDAARANLNAIAQHARQEALREAKVIITQAATWTPQSVVAILDRLAREGVNE